MSFQDDAQILSRLGILESTEESPRKATAQQSPRKSKPQERERFVDVNIDGEVTSQSEDDDDTIFDKDTLLSSPSRHRVLRRRTESFTCRYVILLATYFALGVSFHSTPDVLYAGNKYHNFFTWSCVGTVVGVFLGKMLLLRISSIMLSFLPMAVLSSLAVILYTSPHLPNPELVFIIQGISIGLGYYVGLFTWFSIWRSHPRKIMFLYALLAFGAGLAILARNDDVISNSLPRPLTKRDINGQVDMALPLDVVNSSSDSDSDNSLVTRPKKPQVAQGISSVETKTKENEEMRVKVVESKANNTNGVDSDTFASNTTDTPELTSSTVVPTTSTTLTAPTTTMSTSSTITSTTISASTTTTSVINDVVSNNYPKDESLENVDLSSLADSTVILVALVVLCTTTALYCIGFACCCLTSKLSVDSKILKMFDANLPGLTSGCKLRLILLQLLCGAAESIVMMSSVHDERMHLACGSVLVVRIITVFLGSAAFSITSLGVTISACLVSAVTLALSPSSSLSLVIISGGVGMMGPLTLLLLESRLSPRPAVLVDSFLFPQQIGRLLAAVVCQMTTSASMMNSLLLVSLSMTVVFCALFRSVSKAARLKEIMEYSSQPVPDAVGEYFSLLERDDDISSDELGEPLIDTDQV